MGHTVEREREEERRGERGGNGGEEQVRQVYSERTKHIMSKT